MLKIIFILISLGVINGCSSFSHYNIAKNLEKESAHSGVRLASLLVPWNIDSDCRKDFNWQKFDKNINKKNNQHLSQYPESLQTHPTVRACDKAATDENFVALAFSGGGARAAVLSSAVIFELSKLDLMKHIDLISSVSGGSLAAALYAISCDFEQKKQDNKACLEIENTALFERTRERPYWNHENVLHLLSKNFLYKWYRARFNPLNLIPNLFTAYDTTDIFSEVLSDNIFDKNLVLDNPLLFKDINPQRPNILINATNNTRNAEDQNFNFSVDEFSTLKSTLAPFEISRAVATSSAFPAAFAYSTLAKFNDQGGIERYVHLFDGGASDNLGITGIIKSINKTMITYQNSHKSLPKNITIILVDAQNGLLGKSYKAADVRKFFIDQIIDTNFIDAFDTLMKSNYERLIASIKNEVAKNTQISENKIKIIHLPLLAFKSGWNGYQAKTEQENIPDFWQESISTAVQREKIWDTIKEIKTGYGLESSKIKCLEFAAYTLIKENQQYFNFGQLKQPANNWVNNATACTQPIKTLETSVFID